VKGDAWLVALECLPDYDFKVGTSFNPQDLRCCHHGCRLGHVFCVPRGQMAQRRIQTESGPDQGEVLSCC
jgi:hypothetical protein